MKTAHELVYEVKRTSQQEKLEDFFSKIDIYGTEMRAQQDLYRRSQALKWIANRWKKFALLSFVLILLMNLLMLAFYKENDSGGVEMSNPRAQIVLEIFGVVQALVAFAVLMGYMLEYLEVNKLKFIIFEHRDKRAELNQLKGSVGYFQREDHEQVVTSRTILQEYRQFESFENTYAKHWFGSFVMDPRNILHLVQFILSVVGVFRTPYYSLLLLDIVQRSEILQSVVKAIYLNWKQLMQTMFLLLIIVYLYGMIAFTTFRDSYLYEGIEEGVEPDFNNYCDSLFMCFASTVNTGIRMGGGIGEALKQLLRDDNLYWNRYFFDLTFFVVVIIIMLNLLFGIIIDAFASLRDERNETDEDVTGRCFICGLSRFEFEVK